MYYIYIDIICVYIYIFIWYSMIIVWDRMSINSWCGLYVSFIGGTTLQDLSRIVVLRLKWEGFLQKSSRSVILQSIFWCSADGDLGESCVGRQADHSQWHCSCTNGSHLSCQGHVTIWALPQSPCHSPPLSTCAEAKLWRKTPCPSKTWPWAHLEIHTQLSKQPWS